ncbi:MAG: tetratricopeptide repeat protein [Gammaproteobacteria bacterium]|nr:tetratricopeptide repeat protein [Gammaproteobacteria bacterium]
MADHYFIIGKIYHIGRQYDKAIAFYQQSLQLAMARDDNTQHFRSQFHLGCCYEAVEQYPQALLALQAAEELQPDNEEVKSGLERLQKVSSLI